MRTLRPHAVVVVLALTAGAAAAGPGGDGQQAQSGTNGRASGYRSALKPGRIARAVVKMSDQYAGLSRSQRGEAEQAVKAAFDEVMAEGSSLSADRLSAALVVGTGRAGLTLASVYPQLIKTSWAMWGNLTDAEKQSQPIGSRTAKRIAGRLGKALVTKPIPIAAAIDILKRRRVERLLRESAVDRAAKRVE